MITQIEKQITQIHFGYSNGDVAVTLADTGFVALAVALTKPNLCNRF